MRARKLGRRVVQIAAVIALGVGVTLGTTAVLADDASEPTTETPAPEVVYEWPEQEPSEAVADDDPATARTAGVDWQ